MAQNIEIKAKVHNKDNLIALIEQIADGDPCEIWQDDTFFRSSKGRLKLRELSPIHGELIHYERPDICGPKSSTYVISVTTEPGQLRNTLEAALGVTGRVRKRRLLYLCGITRIHLDEVEKLGDFIELEVVLGDGDTPEIGHQIAAGLMNLLHIDAKDLLEGAYVDMYSVSF